MHSPLGNFFNDDSFCIDITHANADNGRMWGTLKEDAQSYPFCRVLLPSGQHLH
jgi:hypothetical protein